MSNKVSTIAESAFAAEVLASAQPVLVYFWASWCGPCRLMSPVMDWAASQYGDRLKIVKMEVDPNPQVVADYSVEGVPALRLFRSGELVQSSEGVLNQQRLEEWLNEHLFQAQAS